MPVGGFEKWVRQLDECAKTNKILAPESGTVFALRSLEFLRSLGCSSNFSLPTTYDVEELSNQTPTELWNLFKNKEELWLLKQSDSSAGLSVVFFHPQREPDALKRQIDNIVLAKSSKVWLQRKVTGQLLGASFIATLNRCQLVGVTRNLTFATKSNPFLYAGSVGPIRICKRLEESLQQLGDIITNQTGLQGLFGVDFIFDKHAQKLWLLEINPRYTASMELHDLLNNNSLVKQHLHCFTENNLEPWSTCSQSSIQSLPSIKRVVWAAESISKSQLQQFLSNEKAFSKQQTLFTNSNAVYHTTVHDVPFAIEPIPAGAPVATLILRPTLRTTINDSHQDCEIAKHYRAILNRAATLYR